MHDHGGLAAAASGRELHCVVMYLQVNKALIVMYRQVNTALIVMYLQGVLDPALLASVPDRKIGALMAAFKDVGDSLHPIAPRAIIHNKNNIHIYFISSSVAFH